jgi:hypothetical protein
MSRTAIASTAPLVVDEITLDGKRVQVQSVDLSLEHVILDPQNPRIANTVAASLSEKGEALQNKLAALLWDDSDVRDLYRQVLVNKYFFLDQKGNISEFTGNKSDLLNLMGKKSEDVEKYIKANRLKYDDKYDFARIVAYYNSI